MTQHETKNSTKPTKTKTHEPGMRWIKLNQMRYFQIIKSKKTFLLVHWIRIKSIFFWPSTYIDKL